LVGTTLGHYEILQPLGAGGMGEVYRARDTKLDRDVAIKVLPEDFAHDPDRLARFEREAKLLAAINHPNVAAIYNVEEFDGVHFLVLELVEGATLARKLAAGPLRLHRALKVGVQVAAALEAAHARGIVHRDLKPANIIIDDGGRAKVLDLGIAKATVEWGDMAETAGATDLTAAGEVLGTAPYMSPEHLRGEPSHKQMDVWAFGCVLYEALTGRRAFDGKTSADVVAAVLEREPDWSLLPSGTPPSVESLLRRCLQKRRDQRLHDIGDARLEIEDLMTTGERTVVARQSRRWMPIGALVVAAALLMVAAWALWPAPLLGFEERDWVLIADFQHPEGEAELAQALGLALEVGLQESAHVNVLSRSRVSGVLQRMQLATDTPITEEVGREVCQRESLRGLLVPELTAVGQDYLLTLRLVAPVSGDTVASFSERGDESSFLDSLDRLIQRLRSGLGESSGALSGGRMSLSQVTTGSLEALKRFTAGQTAWLEGRYDESVDLYEEAIEIDPEFAYAYAALGSAYSTFVFRRMDDAREAFEQAMTRIDRVGPHERYFMQAMFHSSFGQPQDAIRYYRLHLDRYPDHLGARFNLGGIYRRLGDCDLAVEEYSEVLRLNPLEPNTLINMATCLVTDGEYEAALDYYRRAFDLQPQWRGQGNLNHEYGMALLQAGRIDEAIAIFEERLAHADPSERGAGHRSFGKLALYRGRFDEAAGQFEEAVVLHESADAGASAARDRVLWAIGEVARGDAARAASLLGEATERTPLVSGWIWLQLQVGLAYLEAARPEQARQVSARIGEWAAGAEETDEDRLQRLMLEAAVANADGRPEAARRILEAGRATQQGGNAFAVGILADVAEQAGQSNQRVELLTEVIELAWIDNEGLVPWILAHYELGEVLERLGRPREAAPYYVRFVELWADADTELPVLQEARRRITAIEESGRQ